MFTGKHYSFKCFRSCVLYEDSFILRGNTDHVCYVLYPKRESDPLPF